MMQRAASALLLPLLLSASPALASFPWIDSPDEGGRVMPELQEANLELAEHRAALIPAFDSAYEAYPDLPVGILEAVAWAGSRWEHRIPEAPIAGHHDMPQVYGVMGLTAGVAGQADHVGDAARALGVSRDAVIADPATQILATAALLSARIDDAGLRGAPVEALTPVLRELSGLPEGGRIAAYAQDAYAFEILLALDRGVDELGADVPSMAIDFTQAFDAQTLALLNAPVLRLVADQDLITLPSGEVVNPAIQALQRGAARPAAKVEASTDYPPALWVASPNYSSRNGTAITHVVIHTVEGSYSSCISWFQNPSSQVSSHYVVRSSDGQVTQMVREADKAWHVGSENPYTVGIEHEGYSNTGSYFTAALYDSSAALTRDICESNDIDCDTAYDGPASASIDVLPQSYHIKGHQHYPNQTHTDPGAYWDWAGYAAKVGTQTTPGGGWGGGGWGGGGGGGGGMKVVLDDFESGEGHFNLAPTYSGTTQGISSSSAAVQASGEVHEGAFSEKLTLVDDSASSADWQVRFLSGGGSPTANTSISASKGVLGFWVYTAASGVSAGPLIDDSDGLELGAPQTIPQGRWTFLSWSMADAGDWDGFVGGNGQLDAGTVTLDALMFFRAQSSSSVDIYIDDVMWKRFAGR